MELKRHVLEDDDDDYNDVQEEPTDEFVSIEKDKDKKKKRSFLETYLRVSILHP